TTGATLPEWTQNFAGYNQTIAATGGTGAQSWSVTAGTYPTGLPNITSGGTIAGNPPTAGTFNFTVQVMDGVGATATKGMTIVINAALNVLTATPMQAWTEGASGYNQTI